MSLALNEWLPPDAVNILLVLFLSFLIGLEREERKAAAAERYAFGGVRTFPLIGLMAYAIAFLSGGTALAELVGFAVVAAFLLLSYANKVAGGGLAGITSEMAGLITYVVGALVFHRYLWIATTISASGGNIGAVQRGRIGHPDRGGQQQRRQGSLRLVFCRRADGQAKHGPAGRTGGGRTASSAFLRAGPDGVDPIVRGAVCRSGCRFGPLLALRREGGEHPAGLCHAQRPGQ